jgi:flagellar export protein FliJ
MFTFRLEAVRTIRMNNEEQALMKLGREQTVLQNRKQQLQDYIAARAMMMIALEEKEQQNVSGGFIRLYTDAILAKEHQIALLHTTIASQEQVVEQARFELNERVKERKIIDTLYDRDYAVFLDDERKREQDESDEMAVLRYGGIS